jgi:hypothetical protein
VPQLRLLHHADPPTPPDALPQNKLFGSLVGSAACTVQLELRPSGAAAAAAGGVQPSVTLKNRRDELETMPLFSSKDTISGEVRGGPKLPQSSCERRAGCPALGRRAAATAKRQHPKPDAVPPQVKVTPIPGKRADHQGIRVQLLGEVELAAERGHPHQFLSLGGRRRSPPAAGRRRRQQAAAPGTQTRGQAAARCCSGWRRCAAARRAPVMLAGWAWAALRPPPAAARSA